MAAIACGRFGKIIQDSATPAGFETVRSIAKHHEGSRFPAEKPKNHHPSRRLTSGNSSKVAKLALLASNAVKNLDLERAAELLRELMQITGAPTLGAMTRRVAQ